MSGALTLFLRQRVEIASKFEAYLLGNAKRADGHEARLRHKSAHQKFIQLCEEEGVESWEWPLCVRRRGRESIRQHVERFLDLRYDDVVGSQYGMRAKARSHTSNGYESRLSACRPFDIVEMDEHKCGFIGSIGIPTPEGVRWLPIERLTILLVVDRWLRLILGYKIIFRREANADDVLDALHSAISHEAPRSHCLGFEAQSTLGLPEAASASLDRCGFNQLLFDNALIHLATDVSDRARDFIGCDFNFGPVRRFERRATIENVFGGLERLGFCRLPTTVGSAPHDPRRQEAEKAAVKARLTAKEIIDLVESVIVDHNRRTSKSNFGSEPVTRLKAAWYDVDGTGVIFPYMPPTAKGVASLDVSVVPVTIRGNKSKGRRPYFTFEGETYTGTEMARDWELINTLVFAYVSRHAIREIRIFSKSGAFIDTATVMGRWRHTEHTRELRKHINDLIQDGYLRVRYEDCPVHQFLGSIMSSKAPKKSLSALAEDQVARNVRSRDPAAGRNDLVATDETSHRSASEATKEDGAGAPEDDEFLDYRELTAFEGAAG
ncbi:hypothetical protein CH75_08915 [Dyella jiangningensis]|nr:hypothetical protein CH75_08915 [Dyella jiangningensis]